jgi:HEXXH motif-containing protein
MAEGGEALAEVVALLREGRWIFPRLGPRFLEELALRVRETSGEEPQRLRALPSYRLAAMALGAVEPAVALDGEDGPGVLLDLAGGAPPPFWRSLLQSFNANGYSPDSPTVEYCRPTAANHRALDAGLALLKERAPHAHAAVTGWVSRIMVVQGASVSGSSPRFCGCLLLPAGLFEVPPRRFVTGLIHELAHQEVFVLNAYDRLTDPSGDDVWRFSAFAGVSRPTVGRLHAAHALFRLIQLSRQTSAGTFVNRSKLWRTLRTFRKGELTPLGQALVDEVYRRA